MNLGLTDVTEIFGADLEFVEVFKADVPILAAYENALGALQSFDAIFYRFVDSNGAEGWGEAFPVVGYSPESPDQAWALTKDLLARLSRKSVSNADYEKFAKTHPFVIAGIEEGRADLKGPFRQIFSEHKGRAAELVGTVNTLDADAAPEYALKLVDEGYHTLKVKVGYDADADARRVSAISDVLPDDVRIRVDANQGYNTADAIRFVKNVPTEVVEIFEQPVDQHAWENIEAVAKASPVPLMLDESIYGEADIRRSADVGNVKAIKLKMSKTCGPAGLGTLTELAKSLDLDVVIGNGIASDIGCFHEVLMQVDLDLRLAGDMNGFTKLRQSIMRPSLSLQGPRAVLPDEYPTVDRDALVDISSETQIVRVNGA